MIDFVFRFCVMFLLVYVVERTVPRRVGLDDFVKLAEGYITRTKPLRPYGWFRFPRTAMSAALAAMMTGSTLLPTPLAIGLWIIVPLAWMICIGLDIWRAGKPETSWVIGGRRTYSPDGQLGDSALLQRLGEATAARTLPARQAEVPPLPGQRLRPEGQDRPHIKSPGPSENA